MTKLWFLKATYFFIQISQRFLENPNNLIGSAMYKCNFTAYWWWMVTYDHVTFLKDLCNSREKFLVYIYANNMHIGYIFIRFNKGHDHFILNKANASCALIFFMQRTQTKFWIIIIFKVWRPLPTFTTLCVLNEQGISFCLVKPFKRTFLSE